MAVPDEAPAATGRARLGWLVATTVLLGTAWCLAVLPRMAAAGDGPPFPLFAFVDFRDTVWHPLSDFVQGEVPYDVTGYLHRHPQAQEFLLYVPSYFFLLAPLLALPYPLAVGLWIFVLIGCITWLARYCLELAIPQLLNRQPWLVPLAALLLSLTPVGNQPLRSGQLAIPCAVGALVAITSRRSWVVVLGTCLALVKPPVGLPLLLVLGCLNRWRQALLAVVITVVVSAPILIAVVHRLGGPSRSVQVLLDSVRFAGTSPYGGTGAAQSTRVDVIGALGRIGVFPPSALNAILFVLVLLSCLAAVRYTARVEQLTGMGHGIAKHRMADSPGISDDLGGLGGAVGSAALLATATCTLVLVVPNELYASLPLTAAFALAVRAVRDRTLHARIDGTGRPIWRGWPALLAALLAVPFLNVHRIHAALRIPDVIGPAIDGAALVAAVLSAVLWSRRLAAGRVPGGFMVSPPELETAPPEPVMLPPAVPKTTVSQTNGPQTNGPQTNVLEPAVPGSPPSTVATDGSGMPPTAEHSPIDPARAGRWPVGAPATWVAACILSLLVPWRSLGINHTLVSDACITVALVWGLTQDLRRRRMTTASAPDWTGPQPSSPLRAWPIYVGMAGLGLSALSAMGSPDPARIAQGLFRIVEVFFVFPAAFLLALRRRADVILVLVCLAVLIGLQGIIGVIQTVTKTGALIEGEPIRAVGTFGADNIGVLATMSASGLALATGFAVSYSGKPRWGALGLAGVFAAGLVSSLSRASWIATGVMVLVLLTRFSPRRAAVAATVAVLGYAGLSQAATSLEGPIGERLASLLSAGQTPDQSVIDRYSLWEAAQGMVNDHPVLGVGPLQFQEHRDSYAPLALLGSSDIGQEGAFERQALLSPHNLYLLLSSELGIPAAVCLLFLIVGTLIMAVARLVGTPRQERLAWAVGLSACGMLICVTIDSLFGDLGGPTSIYVGWSVGLGCWWVAHRPDPNETRPPLATNRTTNRAGSEDHPDDSVPQPSVPKGVRPA